MFVAFCICSRIHSLNPILVCIRVSFSCAYDNSSNHWILELYKDIHLLYENTKSMSFAIASWWRNTLSQSLCITNNNGSRSNEKLRVPLKVSRWQNDHYILILKKDLHLKSCCTVLSSCIFQFNYKSSLCNRFVKQSGHKAAIENLCKKFTSLEWK